MKPGPISKRARAQIAATIVVATAFAFLIVWLQKTAPLAQTPATLDLVDHAPTAEFVSCNRTLPEADDSDDVSQTVSGTVGRVSSTGVNQCPRRFDGRLVTYVGEAVGDVLRRDGGAWVQINDDGYGLVDGPLPSHRNFSGTNSGLAIWLPDELVDVVATPGRRGLRGDIIEVVGVLHRVDPDDGGGLTIRAREARLLAGAARIDQPVHRSQAITALLLALVALVLIVRERQTRGAT